MLQLGFRYHIWLLYRPLWPYCILIYSTWGSTFVFNADYTVYYCTVLGTPHLASIQAIMAILYINVQYLGFHIWLLYRLYCILLYSTWGSTFGFYTGYTVYYCTVPGAPHLASIQAILYTTVQYLGLHIWLQCRLYCILLYSTWGSTFGFYTGYTVYYCTVLGAPHLASIQAILYTTVQYLGLHIWLQCRLYCILLYSTWGSTFGFYTGYTVYYCIVLGTPHLASIQAILYTTVQYCILM